MTSKPKLSRALVVRAGALGDVLLLRPVITSLRSAGASVVLLAPSRSGSALLGSGPEEAERLMPWESPEAAPLFAWGARGTLLHDLDALDLVLCYSRNRQLAQNLGARAQKILIHDPHPAPTMPPVHASRWLSSPLGALGVEPVKPLPLRATEAEWEQVRPLRELLPDSFLAVHPGSGSPRKNWPLARFAELIRRVSPGRPWLLSLGPADEAAATLATEPGAVVTRDLWPRPLGALLAQAALYLGNDSGVSHLAAAFGAPTVALFGPTDPRVWAPQGPRVHTLRGEDGDLQCITVDEVARAIAQLTTFD